MVQTAPGWQSLSTPHQMSAFWAGPLLSVSMLSGKVAAALCLLLLTSLAMAARDNDGHQMLELRSGALIQNRRSGAGTGNATGYIASGNKTTGYRTRASASGIFGTDHAVDADLGAGFRAAKDHVQEHLEQVRSIFDLGDLAENTANQVSKSIDEYSEHAFTLQANLKDIEDKAKSMHRNYREIYEGDKLQHINDLGHWDTLGDQAENGVSEVLKLDQAHTQGAEPQELDFEDFLRKQDLELGVSHEPHEFASELGEGVVSEQLEDSLEMLS